MVDVKGHGPALAIGSPAKEAGHAGGPGRIICFGGAAVDRKFMAAGPIKAGTSNPCTGSWCFGGVARNVAANLARLGVGASLVSVVGDDANGRALVRDLLDLGVDAEGVRSVPERRTAEYAAVLNPDRSLAAGMADMAIFDLLGMGDLSETLARPGTVDWIFADGNLPAEVLEELLRAGSHGSARLALDVVSTPKAERLPQALSGIDLLFLNLDEAAAVVRVPATELSPVSALRQLQGRGVAEVVLTLGPEGVMLCDTSGDISHFRSVTAKVVDVTGAGDALIGATLAWRLGGAAPTAATRIGVLAAALTIEQEGSTHPDLCRDLLASEAKHRFLTAEAGLVPGNHDT